EPHLDRTRATAGAAGTGSGGGGGGHFYKQHGCGVADVTGGAGGCGAFLLRTTGANSYRPVAEIERISQVAGSESTVGAAVSLRNAGLSGAASLALVYGPEPDSLVFSASVAEDAGPGVYEAEISGLTPGSTWHFAPVASEGRYVVTGAIRSVTLPAASVPRGEPGLSGLWQTLRSGTSATFRDIFTNAALWAEAGGSNLVAGTIAANSKSTDPVFRDPATDRLYAWVGNWSMFACRGWIYLDGGKTYAFGSRFSDCVRLSIDGRVLVDTYASPVTDAFGTFETDAPGWHEIDARVGRTDVSVWGPDGNDMDSWFHFGLAFNDTGYTLAAPISKWTPLVDPGDGSMLRPEKPAARPVQLVSAAVSGTALSLSGLAGAGGVPARAWAVWGGTDGGVRSPSDWENRRDLGTVAASDAATALSASVPGWGTSAKVARFALETGGVFAWSEPVSFADTAVPSLSAVQVLDASQGDAATFGATLSGGSAPWTVRLWMGADADSLALVASKTLSSAGAFSFALSGLPAGETRWWRIDATDGLGTTVRSDVQSVALPGASRLYDDSDGGDSAWRAVNPYRNRQREIVCGGFLADYGAGETTVRLLRNESSNETFPGAQTTQFHEGEELVVSATGPYELSATLDWDLDVTFNWSVSNSNGRLSWGPTARVRDVKAWCRQLTVVDATDYLRSEAGGLWNDPDSWIPDGVWQDVSGRPRRGSYAAFAAGKASVVAVPDADDDAFPFRFSGFKVGEGADVTVVPAEGASAPALRIKEEAYSVPTRPYVLDLGANSTLRFAGEGLSVNFYKDGPYSASATNTAIEIADGATVTLGNNTGGTAYNANNKADSRLVVTNGARANVKGSIWLTGIGTRMVVDDATVFQDRNGNDNGYIALCGRGMGGAATLVIRGKAPDLRVGARILANDNSSSDRDQFIDFEVPAEGWSVAPIRSADDNKARKFGQGNSSNRFVVPRIPTNAPAALAGRTMDVPLVRFPLGIHETGVTLSTNNLPHPATDWFYVAADPATGQTNLMAHLVGQSDSGEPQVADVRMTAVAEGTASISFVAIPGKDASGANVPAAVSARVLDASEVPVAGVSVVLSASSVSVPATVEAAVSGLPGGGPFTLRIELSDGVHETATEDFAFYPLGDFGAAGSAAAASVAEDGPFTVWTFTNSAERAVFTVTRAGWARVLAVGGGGSGGGGGWD
ncbi:MAG: hypothetical protein IJL06_01125, partial [Kiritimatiellae bacterium]|nr:hypothetical protein [Kiritimatiellia bacterium]